MSRAKIIGKASKEAAKHQEHKSDSDKTKKQKKSKEEKGAGKGIKKKSLKTDSKTEKLQVIKVVELAEDKEQVVSLGKLALKAKEKKERRDKKLESKDSAGVKTPEQVACSNPGIWIGNLSYGVSEKILRSFFAACGDIVLVRMPESKDPESGMIRNKGFAFVYFTEAEAVQPAIALSEKSLLGRKVLIKNADDYRRKGKENPAKIAAAQVAAEGKTTVFVGNLSFRCTKQDLLDHFKEHGKLTVRIGTFEDSGKCKGFAYLDYEDAASSAAVIKQAGSIKLHGRLLRLEYAGKEATKKGRPWERDEEEPSAGSLFSEPVASSTASTPKTSSIFVGKKIKFE